MLSKDCKKVLKWLHKNPEGTFTPAYLYEQGLPAKYSVMKWLYDNNCVLRWQRDDYFDPNMEDPPYEYAISQEGELCLARQRRDSFNEIRAWGTLGIAGLSLVLSVIALALQ